MTRFALFATLVVILAVVTCLFATRKSPVVYTFGNDVRDGHGTMLLNPFRDRSPELAAKYALVKLQEGRCEELLKKLDQSRSLFERRCKEEKLYPIRSWTLTARSDSPFQANLRFRVKRQNGEILQPDPIWIVLDKVDGRWEIRSVEAWY